VAAVTFGVPIGLAGLVSTGVVLIAIGFAITTLLLMWVPVALQPPQASG
jgi:hypothetical protein